MKYRKIALTCLAISLQISADLALAAPNADVVFVTVTPLPAGFTEMNATLGNHVSGLTTAPRGGDLYIRYKDGTVRNLTAAAGYGGEGLLLGNSAISVRDPAVSWDGKKILFSMVVGAPTQRYQVQDYYWQLYELTNFGKNETPVITKVPNQPENYNNIDPIYGTDDRIIFITDRPRNGDPALYPQRDEYESAGTNTGVWSLDPANGDLFILDHSPSGDFEPILDSFGRVLFSRWDHLQRDQQADATDAYGGFNYASEASDAQPTDSKTEVYPEIRSSALAAPTELNGHSFNQFFPWQVNEDGTELETVNHVGRHELQGYFDVSFKADSNLTYHHSQTPRTNQNSIVSMHHLQEDVLQPGLLYGIDGPEFGTHATGQIVSLTAAPSTNPDSMVVTYITHRDTAGTSDSPSANHTGLYRDPLPLSDGSLIAAHTTNTRAEENIGTSAAPRSRYDLRLKTMVKSGEYWIPNENLTSGLSKTVSYWSPDELVSYSGQMWELEPVEVRARTRPTRRVPELPSPEKGILDGLGIDEAALRLYMAQNNLALVVSRNVTTRDSSDKQQPFNLKVEGGATQTVGAGGTVYDVAFQQFFQGDQIRGYYGSGNYGGTPWDGRRVLAQLMHDAVSFNPASDGPAGTVKIATDGSVAAFVPARRAMTYQLTDSDGKGIVRERYWLTFQPGEIRVCASCHGVNTVDQSGNDAPVNPPEALGQLLAFWKELPKTETPEFAVTIKKPAKSNRAIIRVSGKNQGAADKYLTISAKLNSVVCSGVLGSINTDSTGKGSLRVKLPRTTIPYKLGVSALYSSVEVARASRRIATTGGVPTKKALRRLCEKLIK